jgi:hypothetical protein
MDVLSNMEIVRIIYLGVYISTTGDKQYVCHHCEE